MTRIVALLFFILIPLSAQAQVPSFSRWMNTRTSTLSVWVVDPATGAFTGTYVNNASGFGCVGVPYQAQGVTQGTAVSFSVVWSGFGVPDCKSKTTWRGQAVGPTMKTKWVLNYIGSDGKPHQQKGIDVFTRQ